MSSLRLASPSSAPRPLPRRVVLPLRNFVRAQPAVGGSSVREPYLGSKNQFLLWGRTPSKIWSSPIRKIDAAAAEPTPTNLNRCGGACTGGPRWLMRGRLQRLSPVVDAAAPAASIDVAHLVCNSLAVQHIRTEHGCRVQRKTECSEFNIEQLSMISQDILFGLKFLHKHM